MDIELERFKSEISLSDFAQAEFGYLKDKAKSSKNSLVLRAGGDTIVISAGESGHDIYFNRHDESDSGSIIDFVKNRVGDNNPKLVRVRQALRPYCSGGGNRPAAKMPAKPAERPEAPSIDLEQIRARASQLKPYAGKYLTSVRKLNPDVIAAFDVRQDDRGNACFLHRSLNGITGWEAKNEGYTNFSTGGLKTLFMVQLGPKVELAFIQKIVVTEASIDSLSHAQMKYQASTSVAYISTGGSFSELQKTSLKQVLTSASSALVILGTDNDTHDKRGVPILFAERPGEIMAKQVQALAPERPMVRELPVNKDWNEDLVDGTSRSLVY